MRDFDPNIDNSGGMPEEGVESNPLQSLDFGKIWMVLKKSLLWIIVIFIITISISYLYIRYTKPVYESSSLLKLDIKSEAKILGFEGLSENQNYNNLSGEIELIKSNLFFDKVLDVIDLDVSYYAYGRVIDAERYGNSPIRVEYELHNERFYDKPIDVKIIDNQRYELSYELNGRSFNGIYRYGEEIRNRHFILTVFLTNVYSRPFNDQVFYFTINSERALMNYLQEHMNVEPVNFKASTIRVSFKDHNEVKARDLVKAIDSLYLQYTQRKKNEATNKKINFIEKQLANTEDKLAKYEDYFENFTIHNKTTSLEKEISKSIGRMELLDSQKIRLQEKIEGIEKLISNIKEGQKLGEKVLANGAYPASLREEMENLYKLYKERELILASYERNTFAYRKQNQQIEMLEKEILESLNSFHEQYQEDLQNIIKNKASIEEKFTQMPSKGTEYDKMQRYYNLYEEFYLSLMQKKNEFEIAEAGTVTDFVILSPANLPTQPVSPDKRLVYGAGAGSGFLFSILFVVFRYLLTNKITGRHEVESLTPAPVLGVLPSFKKAKKSGVNLVTKDAPKSALSEALRTVRTNMQFITKEKKQVITITSTVGGEGKTFVAVNLGGIMAFSGQKVLLLDLDLRKPRVHDVFGQHNNNMGMSTLLINRYSMEECIIATGVEGYDFIPAGPTPPNPSELIISPEYEKLIEKAKELYDYIIIDTPPVGLVTDGVLAGKNSDIPIYIMRADYSRKIFAKTLNQLIDKKQFKYLSVILNDVKLDQGYYGYYGYGSGYYEEKNSNKSKFFSKVKNFFG